METLFILLTIREVNPPVTSQRVSNEPEVKKLSTKLQVIYSITTFMLPHRYVHGIGLLKVNPLHAKFFRGNINIYSYFASFLHIDITRVVEILH